MKSIKNHTIIFFLIAVLMACVPAISGTPESPSITPTPIPSSTATLQPIRKSSTEVFETIASIWEPTENYIETVASNFKPTETY